MEVGQGNFYVDIGTERVKITPCDISREGNEAARLSLLKFDHFGSNYNPYWATPPTRIRFSIR